MLNIPDSTEFLLFILFQDQNCQGSSDPGLYILYKKLNSEILKLRNEISNFNEKLNKIKELLFVDFFSYIPL